MFATNEILRALLNQVGLESSSPHYWNTNLAYKCPVKKFGTVLYHHGGDLVHALSMSLGQNRTQTSALQKGEKSQT